jgi:ribonuclease BN (tRNA processing enzyme)
VDLRELPAKVSFEACPYEEWRVGGARIRAAIVAHRGVTVGYRISEGDTTLCYLPDHEPALGTNLEHAAAGWISGMGLAAGATLLIHDGQYTEREYPSHLGWGHSSVRDAVVFALKAEPARLVLFHHDPTHDDDTLDVVAEEARGIWESGGRETGELALAREGDLLTV